MAHGVDLGVGGAGEIVSVLEPERGDGLVPLHHGAEQGHPLVNGEGPVSVTRLLQLGRD